jgi:hypothetical protein
MVYLISVCSHRVGRSGGVNEKEEREEENERTIPPPLNPIKVIISYL